MGCGIWVMVLSCLNWYLFKLNTRKTPFNTSNLTYSFVFLESSLLSQNSIIFLVSITQLYTFFLITCMKLTCNILFLYCLFTSQQTPQQEDPCVSVL